MGSQRGFQLLDVVISSALLMVLLTLSVPPLLRAVAGARVRAGAAEVAGIFQLAKSYAVRYSAHVGVRFQDGSPAFWRLYYDGDGDGIRADDIAAGIDPEFLGKPLGHLGPAARFGFPPGPAPRDPGNLGRRLDRLEDPIRFNRSNIASFGPLGTATPGTVYLTDGRSRLSAVRVTGTTGRIRILVYDERRERWR
ncbi:MAG: GspH/FimT family pseudopilin [Acidobacteriota bacterium]